MIKNIVQTCFRQAGKQIQIPLNYCKNSNQVLFKKFLASPQQFYNFCSQEQQQVEGKKEVLNVLKKINGQDLISTGLVTNTEIDQQGNVIIKLKLDKNYMKIKKQITSELKQIPWIADLKIQIASQEEQAQQPIAEQVSTGNNNRKAGLQHVKKVIAVSSCKGGVGKSTVAVNLAFSLKKLGKKVGIFDADIYGPSLPTMISKEQDVAYSEKENPNVIIPIDYEGIKAMSYGFVSKNKAIMRGAMVSQLVSQLLYATNWGELDYLILDMPPGTGDIQLTICQESSLDAAVIVTTPQRLSFVDVVKGIEMFDVLKVPTVSIVENMSSFICENCNHEHQIFGMGYLQMLKQQFGIQNSFGIPLMTKLSQLTDSGLPAVLVLPEQHTLTKIYSEIAQSVEREIKQLESHQPPSIEYKKESQTVVIKDQNEGKVIKEIKSSELRKQCQCAVCIDEFTGKKLLDDSTISDDVHPTQIDPKGNYAVGVVWSDGHRSSIYPYSVILSDKISGI